MLLILLLSWAMGIGCSDKGHVPGGILSKDKMEQVMWDMAQADQYAALYLAKDSAHIDRKAETMRLYAEVFRLHQVTADEFRKSYRYYLGHPELNQLLFDSVIARGVRARTELYDRPGFQYHTPAPPANVARSGVVRPGVVPGPVRPGVVPAVARPGGGAPGEMIQRMREAAARKQDSIRRATRVKRDSTDRKKGRP
jgi:hypothetical protein